MAGCGERVQHLPRDPFRQVSSLVDRMEAAWAEVASRPQRDTVMITRPMLDAIMEYKPTLLSEVDVWLIPDGPTPPSQWWSNGR